MKQKIHVRFANESTYTAILLDVEKLQDVEIYADEVFATVDGIRIAMPRHEYEEARARLES